MSEGGREREGGRHGGRERSRERGHGEGMATGGVCGRIIINLHMRRPSAGWWLRNRRSRRKPAHTYVTGTATATPANIHGELE